MNLINAGFRSFLNKDLAMTYILAFVVLWYLVPFVALWLTPLMMETKLRASWCFAKAAVINFICLIPSITAPIVVPIALIFTKYEDDKLPWLFRFWDNDISINGDPIDKDGENAWALDYKKNAYYAKSPPRSFWARFVWLGLRNRGTWLSQRLGYKYKIGEFKTMTVLGNPATGRYGKDGAGWVLRNVGNKYQFMQIIHLTNKLCLRIHYGYKLFDRERAPVVAIGFSVLSWFK